MIRQKLLQKLLFPIFLKPIIAAQFIKEDDIDDRLLKNAGGDGSIDSLFWATKVGAKVENFTAYMAYSQTGENEDGDEAYKNAIITSWLVLNSSYVLVETTIIKADGDTVGWNEYRFIMNYNF